MSKSEIVLLFPGQGAQYVGMGRDLAREYAVVQETFAMADEALGFSISDLCFNGPEDQLTPNRKHPASCSHHEFGLLGRTGRSRC